MADVPERSETSNSGTLCWRTRVASRIGAVGVALFLSVLSCLLIFDGVDGGARAWGGLILVSSWVGCYLFAFRPRIRLAQGVLVIVNPLRTHRLETSSSTKIRSGYSGLIIRADHGKEIDAWAVQKMNISEWVGRETRSDRVAREIVAALETGREASQN